MISILGVAITGLVAWATMLVLRGPPTPDPAKITDVTGHPMISIIDSLDVDRPTRPSR